MDEEQKAKKAINRKIASLIILILAPLVICAIVAAVLEILEFDRIYSLIAAVVGLTPVIIYSSVIFVKERKALNMALSVKGWHEKSGTVTACKESSFIDTLPTEKKRNKSKDSL